MMHDSKFRSRAFISTAVLFIISAGVILTNPLAAAAQVSPITYQNPLASVGEDQNLYITRLDGTGATLIASEVQSIAHWSPQGTQLAFIRIEAGIYRVDSGRPPNIVLTNTELGHRALAWSPDGKQIAYIEGSPGGVPTRSLRLVQMDGTSDRVILLLDGACVGDGPGPGDAERVVIGDRDQEVFMGIF